MEDVPTSVILVSVKSFVAFGFHTIIRSVTLFARRALDSRRSSGGGAVD